MVNDVISELKFSIFFSNFSVTGRNFQAKIFSIVLRQFFRIFCKRVSTNHSLYLESLNFLKH